MFQFFLPALLIAVILSCTTSDEVSSGCKCARRGYFQKDSFTSEIQRAVKYAGEVFEEEEIPRAELFFQNLKSVGDSLRGVLAGSEDSGQCVDILKSVIYDKWGIKFDSSRNEIASLLPHTIVSRKKGSCLGVSLLFLMLAEKIGCPLKGVLIPGHFLVRYESNSISQNIEPNLGGFYHPDSYYRKRYTIERGSWYDMHVLTSEEVVGVLYYNMGNICRLSKKNAEAARCYRRCVSRFGDYAEGWGNLAIVLEKQGKKEAARASFDSAFALRPRMPNLCANIGNFELKHNNYAAARDAFRTGIKHFEQEPGLLYGLALSYYGMHKMDSAMQIASFLREQFPAFEKNAQLKKLLK